MDSSSQNGTELPGATEELRMVNHPGDYKRARVPRVSRTAKMPSAVEDTLSDTDIEQPGGCRTATRASAQPRVCRATSRAAERRPDGNTARKYVLVAFDFAMAYDLADHRLLRVSLIEQGLPLCLVSWVWQWLRDRRVKVEVSGMLSEERIFRAAP